MVRPSGQGRASHARTARRGTAAAWHRAVHGVDCSTAGGVRPLGSATMAARVPGRRQTNAKLPSDALGRRIVARGDREGIRFADPGIEGVAPGRGDGPGRRPDRRWCRRFDVACPDRYARRQRLAALRRTSAAVAVSKRRDSGRRRAPRFARLRARHGVAVGCAADPREHAALYDQLRRTLPACSGDR